MEKKQPRGRLFKLAVIGLGLLIACDVIAFGFIAFKGWDDYQERRAMHTGLQRERALWEAQGIISYRVTYTSTTNNIASCQGAIITVRNYQRTRLVPDCDSGSSTYGFDISRPNTMDQLYVWLDERFSYNYDWEQLIIEYHPELHYITRVVWQGWEWGPVTEVIYGDLVAE